MLTAKVFQSGNSQAIRIPKEFHTDTKNILDILKKHHFKAVNNFSSVGEEERTAIKNSGLKLQQDITLREGKYIVGDDIMPGTYTLKCTETSGDTYGGLYSSLGDLYGGSDSPLGGLMGSLGGMMSDIINTEVEIIGDYGTVLKSYELKAGESVQITLFENTALKISEGTCVLTAE